MDSQLSQRELDTLEWVRDQTKERLETILISIQHFKDSAAIDLFQHFCQAQKDILVDTVLDEKLQGVESLFNRESLMGEAVSWGRMGKTFDELEELLHREIKSRK